MSTRPTDPARMPTATTVPTSSGATMQLLHEDLARAQTSARLGEAHPTAPARPRARVRTLGRRAEALAQQARLALARSL